MQVDAQEPALQLAATGTDGPVARAIPPSSEGHTYRGPISNGHWVDAADLKPGYRLLGSGPHEPGRTAKPSAANDNTPARWAEVVDVWIEQKPLKAYNLTVADWHTFFVRGPVETANDNASAVWVHNACRYVPASVRKQIFEAPDTPSHVKGYIQNQRNQGTTWSKIKLPDGYDWGHPPTAPHPARHGPNTRLEYSRDNRARGAKKNLPTRKGNLWR